MTRQSDGHSGFPERTFSFQLASDEARLARGAQSEAMSDLTLSPAGRANWFVYGSLVVGVVVYELSGGEAGEPTSGLLMGVTFAIGILLWLATWSWRLWTGRGSFVIDTPTTVHVTESGFAVEARGLSARRSTGASAGPQASINQRKTTARVSISGSPKLRDGSFALAGTSGVCGEIPKEASLTGQATFVIEFPNDGKPGDSITSISFGSHQLVGGVTTASLFNLNVTVMTANGGRPPAYVLNTDSKNPKSSGKATLSTKGSTTTLHLVGQNDMSETIDLEVSCF